MIKLLLMSLLVVFPIVSHADTANGSFKAPTERVDKTLLPLSEIAGFDLYLNGIKIDNPVDVLLPTLPNTDTTYEIQVSPGDHVLTIVTVDTEGRESTHSRDILIHAKAPPNPVEPLDVVVTVTVTIKKVITESGAVQ